jgi:hypothetical protein
MGHYQEQEEQMAKLHALFSQRMIKTGFVFQKIS